MPEWTDDPRSRLQGELEQFDQRFSRCHNTLHFIASQILGCSELAGHAVQNCRVRASRNPRSFESEGAFCSWIFRLLITEALSMEQTLQMASKAGEAHRLIHGDLAPTCDDRTRLQVLIADLLSENQKLLFKVAQLEQETHRAERMLAEAMKQARMAVRGQNGKIKA